jgi:hypothetical protein
MALALAEPARVNRLILVATSPRAVGPRWLVRAGMMVADLPVLRGRHRQPRSAMKAQFDATTRFDATARLGPDRTGGHSAGPVQARVSAPDVDDRLTVQVDRGRSADIIGVQRIRQRLSHGAEPLAAYTLDIGHDQKLTGGARPGQPNNSPGTRARDQGQGLSRARLASLTRDRERYRAQEASS